MRPRAAVVGGSLFWSTSAFATFDSGNTLFDNCNNPNDASKQFYCLGYLAGVSDLLDGMHIICTRRLKSNRRVGHRCSAHPFPSIPNRKKQMDSLLKLAIEAHGGLKPGVILHAD